jgi:uncharacterized protein (TIGR01777 family)
MAARRVILAGGNGFLGRLLAKELLARGDEVIVLTRSPRPDASNGRQVAWDGKTLAGMWSPLVDGAAAVVNVTGRSVNCRHTAANREEILASRVDSVRALGEAIRGARVPPTAWVQAGSLAIYGDTGDAVLDESAAAGEGFTADVCRQWEAAFDAAESPATRKTLLRIGLVIGPGGGIMAPMTRLARCFLGGAAGSGQQYLSWVDALDLNEMFRWGIDRTDVEGVFNATGPQPATNAEFMATLRRVLGRPWSPPVPAPIVRMGAWLMGTEGSLALTGRRCVPKQFLELGFTFQRPDLEEALREAL